MPALLGIIGASKMPVRSGLAVDTDKPMVGIKKNNKGTLNAIVSDKGLQYFTWEAHPATIASNTGYLLDTALVVLQKLLRTDIDIDDNRLCCHRCRPLP